MSYTIPTAATAARAAAGAATRAADRLTRRYAPGHEGQPYTAIGPNTKENVVADLRRARRALDDAIEHAERIPV